MRREREQRNRVRALLHSQAIERRNRIKKLRILGRILKRGGSAKPIELERLSGLRVLASR
jgi:hypothetical protein